MMDLPLYPIAIIPLPLIGAPITISHETLSMKVVGDEIPFVGGAIGSDEMALTMALVVVESAL